MPPADIGLGCVFRVRRGLADRQFALVQPGTQLIIGFGLVLVLAALVLALDDDPGRQMRDPDRRIGRVDVLAASARSAIGIDAQLAFVDVDVDILVDDRIDPHTRKAGVPPRRAVIGADADKPVNAAFRLRIAIGVFALQQHGRRFDAGLFAGMLVDQLHLQAPPFGPARVHALQHASPVLAFGAAGTGVDLDIGVVAVRLAGKQRLDLVPVGPLGKRGEAGDALIDHRVIAFGLGQFHQFDGIVALTLDRPRRGDRLIQAATFAHHLLRGLGVVPQRLVLHSRVEFVEPAQRAVPVEETPQQRQRLVDCVDMSLRFGAHLKLLQRTGGMNAVKAITAAPTVGQPNAKQRG